MNDACYVTSGVDGLQAGLGARRVRQRSEPVGGVGENLDPRHRSLQQVSAVDLRQLTAF